jgi:hypothetical protein
VKAYDEAKHCGALTKHGAGGPCTQGKGQRTGHPGQGRCWLHGGRSPNAELAGARAKAAAAVTKLGLPVGTGDPMILLTKAVQHAEGYLEATGAVLAERAGEENVKPGDVAAIAGMHAEAIRAAARVGKAAVDADVADRLAALDERTAGLVMRFVGELFDQVVPAKRRPELLAWARGRLAELATEYDGSAVVH